MHTDAHLHAATLESQHLRFEFPAATVKERERSTRAISLPQSN